MRAKRKLLTLGFITEERITARAGRGGQANALALTPAGCAWLGVTTGRAGMGGLQHQYLVTRIARAIKNSAIEFTAGDKRIDIVFAYRATYYDFLIRALECSSRFSDQTPQEWASIGIEIESTEPLRTAPNNATKNADVGIDLTLIATLPKDVERTTAAISKLSYDVRARTAVIDALTLLHVAESHHD